MKYLLLFLISLSAFAGYNPKWVKVTSSKKYVIKDSAEKFNLQFEFQDQTGSYDDITWSVGTQNGVTTAIDPTGTNSADIDITGEALGWKTATVQLGDATIVNTQAIAVIQMDVKIRAKKSSNPDAYLNAAYVCAGGINSNAHTAEIEITIQPAISGVEIPCVLSGTSTTSNIIASLNMSSTTTDSNGKINGVLISGDQIESGTVTAGNLTASIFIDWNIDWNSTSWVSNPEYIAPTTTETVTLTHHGEPVNGHNIKFVVEQLTYVDPVTFESIVTLSTGPYASFSPDTVLTDSSGICSSTLTTTETVEVIEENLIIYDLSVIADTVTNGDDVNGVKRPKQVSDLFGNLEFQKGLAPTIYFKEKTATQFSAGTSPGPSAVVSAGQDITLKLTMEDWDEVRQIGSNGPWEKLKAPANFGGSRIVILTLTSATFTGTNNVTQKTFLAEYDQGYFTCNNIKISVDDPWDGTVPVKIDIKVLDNITVPAHFVPDGGVNTGMQDDDFETSITWKKVAKPFPTECTPLLQSPGLGGDPESGLETLQTTAAIIVVYQFGPNTDGLRSNFLDITYDEVFGVQTSNLVLADLSALTLLTKPNTWTKANWISHFFSGTGNNITFKIGEKDHGDDLHSGRIFAGWGSADTILSDIGQKKTIYVDLPQDYQCPQGTKIGKSKIIRRQRAGQPDGSGLTQFKKTELAQ